MDISVVTYGADPCNINEVKCCCICELNEGLRSRGRMAGANKFLVRVSPGEIRRIHITLDLCVVSF